MYLMFAMHGKIAAFTDNVRGHTKLHTLCTLCWRCSYVALLFDSWLYEKSLRTGMRSRPHAVTCSRQYVICCLLRQFRNTFNWVCVLCILWVMFLEQLKRWGNIHASGINPRKNTAIKTYGITPGRGFLENWKKQVNTFLIFIFIVKCKL